jgi:hypothetical protein
MILSEKSVSPMYGFKAVSQTKFEISTLPQKKKKKVIPRPKIASPKILK